MNDERHSGLIVEDDLEMATELKELFTALGLGYVHAATAEEALPLIEAGGFCFALMDLQIKANADSVRARIETGITLFQLARKRYPRRNDDDKHIMQIIAMSGHAKDRIDAIKVLQLGANDFFAKPFNENDVSLDTVIRRCLRMSGRRDHADCAHMTESALAPTATRSSAPPAGPVAVLYSHEHGGVPLTADDVKALIAKRKSYDLFLNFAAPAAEGYLAGRTDEKGKYDDVSLTQIAAAMLAELVQERKPVRVASMKCVRHGAIASPVRIIERARTALDVKTGARSWRAIRTIAHVGGDDTTKEFFFDPPSGFRWAVLQAAR